MSGWLMWEEEGLEYILIVIMIKKQSTGSYQQFHNKLKAKFKKEKQERKENLRQIACRNLVQSSNGSNDEQYLKKTGNKWWGKINRHYFGRVSAELLENMRQFTTSDDITQIGLPVILEHFYREVICSMNDQIFFDDSIRILFRLYDKLQQKQKYILASYLCRNTLNSQLLNQPKPATSFNFYSFHSPSINPPKISTPQQLQHFCEENNKIDLELSAFTDDQTYITICLQYETTWRNQNMTEVEKQIQCWQSELQTQHKANAVMWDKIQAAWLQEKLEYPEWVGIEQRVEELKKQLIHSQTFLYFRLGYSDKTSEDFSTAVSYANQNYHESKYVKKTEPTNEFFETDCKICFCTKNEPSNKVIYCDSCNTSFHQSCYGIEHLDEDKELVCDICSYIKKGEVDNNKKAPEPPACQICGRCKFPIKNINDHFYHVSCLILFDFADIHEFKITLKKGVNHQTIMQAVVENEMDQDYCQYCIKHNFQGMKFKCTYPLCTKSFHPICAYLNGCFFQINRKAVGGIQVKIQCRDHFVTDFTDIAFQVYLRRYLCNFRHTAHIKEEQFKQIYGKQLEKLKKSTRPAEFEQGGVKRILNFKKMKEAQHSYEKRRPESLKKSQSVHSNASNSKSMIEEPKYQKSHSSKQKKSHLYAQLKK